MMGCPCFDRNYGSVKDCVTIEIELSFATITRISPRVEEVLCDDSGSLIKANVESLRNEAADSLCYEVLAYKFYKLSAAYSHISKISWRHTKSAHLISI